MTQTPFLGRDRRFRASETSIDAAVTTPPVAATNMSFSMERDFFSFLFSRPIRKMLDRLPDDMLSHVLSFVNQDDDMSVETMRVHTHDYDGYQFHATEALVRCWDVRIFKSLVPISPVADKGRGLFFEISPQCLGLDACTNYTRNPDGSLSFYTKFGEALTLFNWRYKTDAIPAIELYDAIVENRSADLPVHTIVSLYKMPRVPTSTDWIRPGCIVFDSGTRIELQNRFLIICDTRLRRHRMLSAKPEVMLSYDDIHRGLSEHLILDRDREGTLAILRNGTCIFGGTLDTHYHSADEDVAPAVLITKKVHLNRSLCLKIRGRLSNVMPSSLFDDS